MTATVGNYDYIFDWILQSDGQLRILTGATGVVEAKMARAKSAAAAVVGDRDDRSGRFVDDHVVGVNHDHYFNFRLDVDVDGPENTFVRDQLVAKPLPAGHRRDQLAVPSSEGTAPTARTLWRAIPGCVHRGRARSSAHGTPADMFDVISAPCPPMIAQLGGSPRNRGNFSSRPSRFVPPCAGLTELNGDDDRGARRIGGASLWPGAAHLSGTLAPWS